MIGIPGDDDVPLDHVRLGLGPLSCPFGKVRHVKLDASIQEILNLIKSSHSIHASFLVTKYKLKMIMDGKLLC
jgi:hypothetical protein